jgi:hypothetical protein
MANRRMSLAFSGLWRRVRVLSEKQGADVALVQALG